VPCDLFDYPQNAKIYAVQQISGSNFKP